MPPDDVFRECDVYTDLALEASERVRARTGREIPGVAVQEFSRDGIKITRVTIEDENGAALMGKPPGTYVTVEAPELRSRSRDLADRLSGVIAEQLSDLARLPPEATVLVVGLGNWRATPDALGPRVVEQLFVTRHLRELVPPELKGRMRALCAIAPGVLGTTGIETGEVIRGIASRVNPDLVVAVDSLAARSLDRIMTTVQLADTGIHPGSGVGNRRLSVDRESVGAPVIAVGCPTVVYAMTIAMEAIDQLSQKVPQAGTLRSHLQGLDAKGKQEFLSGILRPLMGEMVVTPKEVDADVEEMARIIAGAINAAFHPGITEDEVARYLR
ncbi:MAG: GPR endopeptidase [Bacillota bacterium]|nr:GPR endopeptidase [Bacillota bacterium]MDI7248507.1 GPR endopeptidase [Bacillota bacterium]